MIPGSVLGDGSLRALVIMKNRKRAGGWSLGLTAGWLEYQPIFAVLFLKKSSSQADSGITFERVGCGRLFGTEVDKMFREAEAQDIWLA